MSGNTSSGSKRKRQKVYDSIPRAARCGHCKHCLNPSMKKACITVREQMDREADQEDILDNAKEMYDVIVKGSGGKKTEEKEEPATLVSFFKRIIDQDGGLKVSNIQDLLKYMGKPKTKGAQYQTLCFSILHNTEVGVLEKLCREGLCDRLLKWLEHNEEIKYNKIIKKMLALLLKLPLSVDLVLGPAEGLVKAVRKLKAYKEDEEVGSRAKQVMVRWKKIASNRGTDPPVKGKMEKKEVAPSPARVAKTTTTGKAPPSAAATAATQKTKTIKMNNSTFDPLDQAPPKKAKLVGGPPKMKPADPTTAPSSSAKGEPKEPVVVKTVRMLGRTVAKKDNSEKVLAPSEMKPKGRKGRRITWKDEVFKDAPLCEYRFIASCKSKIKEATDQEAQRREEREREKQEHIKMKQIQEEIRIEEKKKERREVEKERKQLAQTVTSSQWKEPMPIKVWWQLIGEEEKEVDSAEYGVQSERQRKSSPYRCRDPAREFARDEKGMIMTSPSEPPRPQLTANVQNHLKSMLANQALLNNISQIQSLGGGGSVQPTNHQSRPVSSTFYAPPALGNHITPGGGLGSFRIPQQQPVHSLAMTSMPLQSAHHSMQTNSLPVQQPVRSLAPMNMGMSMPMNTQYVSQQPSAHVPMQNQFGGSRPRYSNGSQYNMNNMNGMRNNNHNRNNRVCQYFNTPKVSSRF